MAINIRSVSYSGLIKQTGQGVPTHRVDGKATFVDLLTGYLYTNMTGDASGWKLNEGVNKIGPAEDGTYTDGLFTDFTEDTPIGTAVDRFNELFTALVPPFAPVLSDWSGDKANDVSGKLSFDSTATILGYFPANVSYDGTNPSVSLNGSWTISGKRLGISPANGGNITGVLNYQVPIGAGSPTSAYTAASFRDGESGSLIMYINGSAVTSIDMTHTGATNTTSGNTQSGLVLSACVPSYFSTGAALTAISTRNRTGTWFLHGNDGNIRNGYNYVIVRHLSGSFDRILTRFEWIQDSDTTPTTYSGETLTGLTMTGSKYLSGINYYTGGSALYNIVIKNAYMNTYSTSASAISHTLTNATASSQSIPSCVSNTSDIIISNKTVTINASRLLNQSISCRTNVLRALSTQTSPSSTILTIDNILMDNVSNTSTALVENFNSENYRLYGNSYNTYGSISGGAWDSTQSIQNTGITGYNSGLQVYNGLLVYPSINFSAIVNGPINFNYSSGNCTGNRYFYRYFYQSPASPSGNFTINLQGSNVTFVDNTNSLSGSASMKVDIKLPGSSSQETGYLDAVKAFVTNNWNDGDGSKKSGAYTPILNSNWQLTTGTKTSASSNGYVVLRLTVGQNFTGSLSQITFSYS